MMSEARKLLHGRGSVNSLLLPHFRVDYDESTFALPKQVHI